jgi:hypothetical protein
VYFPWMMSVSPARSINHVHCTEHCNRSSGGTTGYRPLLAFCVFVVWLLELYVGDSLSSVDVSTLCINAYQWLNSLPSLRLSHYIVMIHDSNPGFLTCWMVCCRMLVSMRVSFMVIPTCSPVQSHYRFRVFSRLTMFTTLTQFIRKI